MRTIQVSTDVFAAIWRDRKKSENSEDDILRRRFKLKPRTEVASWRDNPGFYDARYDASWREGEEIFRVYKGGEYRARAQGGKWLLLNNGKHYPTLNALSRATVGQENAWKGWFYMSGNKRRPVAEKRNPTKVSRRTATEEDLFA